MYSIVFKNEHFVIVDKSPCVLSVPSRLGLKETRPCLGLTLEIDLGQKVFPVHRLDFEVSGLIIYALNEVSQREANRWFEQKLISKQYHAYTNIIDNTIESENFELVKEYTWNCKILKGKKRAYESNMGKASITIAKLLNKTQDYFHWELSPITGRSHQLRFELFRHNHAIIGDTLYHSKTHYEKGGIALRSKKILFFKTDNFKKFCLPEEIEIN